MEVQNCHTLVDTVIFFGEKKFRPTHLHCGKFRYFEFVVLSCQYAYCNRPTKFCSLEKHRTCTHRVPNIKVLYYSAHIVEFLQFPPFYLLLVCMLLVFRRPQPILCCKHRVCTPLFALDSSNAMRHRACKIDNIVQRRLLHTHIQSTPVIATSAYGIPHLYRQVFCGASYFLTTNLNIIQLG
jgi:hypothetical protein